MSDDGNGNGEKIRDQATGKFIHWPGIGQKQKLYSTKTYSKALRKAITPGDLQDVARHVLAIAKGEDPKAALAAALVLFQFLAPPPKRIEFEGNIHAMATVRVIAQAIQHDRNLRDSVLALDERVRVASADSARLSGPLGEAGD